MQPGKGRLIVIEAGDGAGKATQTRALHDRLAREGCPVRRISFPDYASESSALVRMYLAGRFGGHAEDVNAYAASAFYAVDRYASYRMHWKAPYDAGELVLADRYTTSNMVHQAVKIEDPKEREAFLEWLRSFEYEKLGLPVPDLVVFLDMEPEASLRLLAARAKETGQARDIHEKDAGYLRRCHAAYRELAGRYGWHRVQCSRDGEPRSVAAIHEEVYAAVGRLLREQP